jgi:hypothetical protein
MSGCERIKELFCGLLMTHSGTRIISAQLRVKRTAGIKSENGIKF